MIFALYEPWAWVSKYCLSNCNIDKDLRDSPNPRNVSTGDL